MVSLTDIYRRAILTPSGCREWSGAITASTGYGRMKADGRGVDTHRAAWAAAHGPIGEGLYVCHRCDNRKCVEVSHLFLGTHADNMRDAHRKGRLPLTGKLGAEVHNAKLTNEAAREIYALAHTPGMRQADIGRLYGVGREVVSQIKRKVRWQHALPSD